MEKPPRHVLFVHNGIMPEPRCFPSTSALARAVTCGGYDITAEGVHVKNGHIPWILPDTPSGKFFQQLLVEGGIPADCTAGFTWKQLRKFLVNSSANLVSITCAKNCGQMLADKEVHHRMRTIYRECVSVLRSVPEYSGAWPQTSDHALETQIFDAIASYSAHFPSTQQDFVAGKPLEIENLNGYVVAMSERLGLAAPENARLVLLLVAPCAWSCACMECACTQMQTVPSCIADMTGGRSGGAS